MNQPKIYLLLLFSILVTSCIPKKDLIYLQDKNNTTTEAVNSINQKPYRLQTNDILVITIKAIEPKLVDIFNTSGNQTTASGNEQSNYFNGYSVDDHGNIRMPILD